MSTVRGKVADEKAEAARELRKLLKPGDTVYTVLRHVSSSGMSRRIDLYCIKNNKPRFLSGWAARVLGYKRASKGDGLVVGGCGMDMGFHVVYSLGYALWPKGFTRKTDRRYGRNSAEANTVDRDGGYALNHEWL